jgi:hypothetical protein
MTAPEPPPPLTLEALAQLRETGQLESLMHATRWFCLIAFEVYPNGTTAPGLVEDPETASQIGQAMAIGDPDDAQGFGIWYVPDTPKPSHLDTFRAGLATERDLGRGTLRDQADTDYQRWLADWSGFGAVSDALQNVQDNQQFLAGRLGGSAWRSPQALSLGLDPLTWLKLLACRVPRADHFAEDTRRIAEYVEADPGKLETLLRLRSDPPIETGD